MALPENRPLDRVWVSSYMADVSTASSSFAVSPVRGYVKKIRGVGYVQVTGSDSTVTAEINGTAVTGISIVIDTDATVGTDVEDVPTSNATSFVNPGDVLEIVSDGASSTTSPMMWYWEIEVV